MHIINFEYGTSLRLNEAYAYTRAKVSGRRLPVVKYPYASGFPLSIRFNFNHMYYVY